MLKLPEKDPMTVIELAKALRKNVATVYRWGSPRGVRGHRLPMLHIGGRTYVEKSAYEAFHNALNKGPDSSISADAAREDSAPDEIDAELDAAGL